MSQQSQTSTLAPNPDVVIYIPGLSSGQEIQRVDTVSQKICQAVDRNAASAHVKFTTSDPREVSYGQGHKARVRTIHRIDGADDHAVVEIFELDYASTLTRRFEEMALFRRLIALFLAMVSSLPQLLVSLVRPNKTFKDKLQMVFASGVFVLLLAYMFILLGTAVYTITQTSELDIEMPAWLTTFAKNVSSSGSTPEATIEESSSGGAGETNKTSETKKEKPEIQPLQMLVIILAALGIISKKNIKNKINSAAVEYLCALNYLRLGIRRQAISGQLYALLEHLEEDTTTYGDFHVVAYSFGSVVALDTFFPRNSPPERIGMVKTLVTLGCPFDMIRGFWPDYFKGRLQLDSAPKWLNVYTPLDALGSDFRDVRVKKGQTQTEVGITIAGKEELPVIPTSYQFRRGEESNVLSFVGTLALRGLDAHLGYWNDSDDDELNSFDLTVAEIFESKRVLE